MAYKRPQRRDFSDNYIGQVGKLVKGKSESFSATFRNSTGEKKYIALFIGNLIAMSAMNHGFSQRTEGEDKNQVIIGTEMLTLGGAKVLINTEQTAPAQGQEVILFDSPELLKKYMSEIDCIWNDGIENIESDVSGNVLYANGVDSYVSQESDLVSVNQLHNQIAEVPHIINSMRLSANDATILNDAAFIYKDLKSYRKTGEDIFKVSKYMTENQYQNNKVTINTARKENRIIQLDYQSLLVLALPGISGGTAQLTIDFDMTAITDLAKLSIEDAVKQMTKSLPAL